MKKTIKLFSVLLGFLAAGTFSAFADEGDDKKKPERGSGERGERPEGARRGGGRQVPKEILEKFDKNKDGKLDADERKEAMAARRAEMLKKYDKDGDGKLSAEERKEMPRRGPGRRPGGDRPEGKGSGEGKGKGKGDKPDS